VFDFLRKGVNKLVDSVAEVAGKGITISEAHLADILDDLELDLLQADVAYDAVEKVKETLLKELVGKKVSKRSEIRDAVRNALIKMLSLPTPTICPPEETPFILLFVGPNGVGKTTTIAKIAYILGKKGYRSVIAAADTFRAGSIEQTEEWAKKVGARVVKHDYGADPAAVAFDAVKSAKARGDHYVLIDTAGRQDTNENLLDQLKKIKRVVKPHRVIFVGEALTGSALENQIRAFDEAVGVDGVVLTKMDADTKGGSAFTVTVGTGKPIMFVGTGEEPDDLKEFRAEEIVDSIISAER
jgi:fused signal recognition particle receptor